MGTYERHPNPPIPPGPACGHRLTERRPQSSPWPKSDGGGLRQGRCARNSAVIRCMNGEADLGMERRGVGGVDVEGEEGLPRYRCRTPPRSCSPFALLPSLLRARPPPPRSALLRRSVSFSARCWRPRQQLDLDGTGGGGETRAVGLKQINRPAQLKKQSFSFYYH